MLNGLSYSPHIYSNISANLTPCSCDILVLLRAGTTSKTRLCGRCSASCPSMAGMTGRWTKWSKQPSLALDPTQSTFAMRRAIHYSSSPANTLARCGLSKSSTNCVRSTVAICVSNNTISHVVMNPGHGGIGHCCTMFTACCRVRGKWYRVLRILGENPAKPAN